MRFSRLTILGCAVGSACAQENCQDDSCHRALLATTLSPLNPLADCNSYLLVAVTPATSTVTRKAATTLLTTKTTTTTSTSYLDDSLVTTRPAMLRRDHNPGVVPLHVRQVTATASNIPAYASACAGPAEYSSACLCIGAKPTTTSFPAPTTTTTTTSTAVIKTTTTSTSVDPCPTDPPGWAWIDNIPGTEVVNLRKITRPRACCQACRADAGCVSWQAYVDRGQEYCLYKRQIGATPKDQCPLGQQTFLWGPVPPDTPPGTRTGGIGVGVCGNAVASPWP